MSIDPVTTNSNTGESFNRYVYGNNSPYKYIDPDGRQAKDSSDTCAGQSRMNCETWGSLRSDSGNDMVDKTSFQHQGEMMGRAMGEIFEYYAIAMQFLLPEVTAARAVSVVLYRVGSAAELASLAGNGGKFTAEAGSMNNKWFAESAKDAAAWAKKFYDYDKQPMFTFVVRLPKHLADKMIRNPRLDNIGPARSADGKLLEAINRESTVTVLQGSVLK